MRYRELFNCRRSALGTGELRARLRRLVAAFGIGATMTGIAVAGLFTLAIVLVLAPETAGRSIEELEGQTRNGLISPLGNLRLLL